MLTDGMGTQTLPVLSRAEVIPEIYRLTPRQRKILVSLSQGKTLDEVGTELGVSRQRIHQVLKATRGRIGDLMDESGLTEAALVTQYLRPALNANQTEFAKFQGKITDSVDTVAWGPRVQALDIAAKMRGMYAPPKMAIRAHSDAFDLELEVVGGQ